MTENAKKFIEFIKNNEIQHNKDRIKKTSISTFQLISDRSTYICNDFAVCFSYTKNYNFSNVIVSLKKIQKYDDRPFFVVLSSALDLNQIYLINSSFINKVSHSSKKLTTNYICGSIVGSNILLPQNDLVTLYDLHLQNNWNDNLQRIVENTKNIKPIYNKLILTKEEKQVIKDAILFNINNFSINKEKNILDQSLINVKKHQNDILKIDNVNQRGRYVELVYQNENTNINDLAQHTFADYKNNDYLIDIKSHIEGSSSSPKFYNIDKMVLTLLNNPQKLLGIYFIIVNNQQVNSYFCSIFDQEIMNNMLVQNCWSGLNSLGTTQLLLDKINFNKLGNIDINQVLNFLNKLNIL